VNLAKSCLQQALSCASQDRVALGLYVLGFLPASNIPTSVHADFPRCQEKDLFPSLRTSQHWESSTQRCGLTNQRFRPTRLDGLATNARVEFDFTCFSLISFPVEMRAWALEHHETCVVSLSACFPQLSVHNQIHSACDFRPFQSRVWPAPCSVCSQGVFFFDCVCCVRAQEF
jgi:hypothetical protein